MEKNLTDRITDAKFEDYSYDESKNYVGERELLVTITLHEYRMLLQAEAKAARDFERDQRWKLQEQVEELKAQINLLRDKLNAPAEEDDF